MGMYKTERFKGPEMRVAYAHGLFKTRTSKKDSGEDVEEYACTLILPKSDTAGMKLLQSKLVEVLKGEWGDKGIERFKSGLIRNPILAGDGKEARNKESGELHPGMGPDVVFIRVKSRVQPKVVDRNVLPIGGEDLLSGYWGFPALNAYAWHNAKNGDGISFGLDMFQMTRKDEVLGGGGGGNPEDFFDKIAVTSEGSTGEGGAADLFDV